MVAISWCAALLLVAAEGPALTRYEYERVEMAMPYKLVLYAADETTANQAADAVFARIHQLDLIFSDYKTESEASRLSAAAPMDKPVAVSREMGEVLQAALKLSAASEGAFDVTIGPLTHLWRWSRRHKELPSPERLQAARAAVGYKAVEFDPVRRTLRLLKPNMRLDFGGIACGYAVDEGLRILRERGLTRAMLDGSGDIGVGDPPPGKTHWRIGIAKLDNPEGKATRYVNVANCAVTTSGDAFQFVEINGVRYSHIVDPRTGLGLTIHSAVTVIAPDCIRADSYTKPPIIMGPQTGFALIEKTPGAAALLFRNVDGKLEASESRRWHDFEDAAR
ncbi:MAG TPA: FAD:protein FMN transferase [Pirellulales bacterium]|jgi:thiamine biosynthesis lipoprotein|nr:FAD:protein FMN transferase [Pirellulales bacterium]